MAGQKCTSRLDWSDLEVLVVLARSGSLSEAARCLKVEHSTVGRRVAALEAALGVRLFDRSPAGYALTAAGEEAAGLAETIGDRVDELRRRLAGRDAGLSGTVRLTTTDSLAARLVVPALPAFHQRHPGIEIEVAVENRTVSLTRREADLALRLGRPAGDSLVARRVGTFAYGLYAARGYLARHPVGAGEFDLSGHSICGYDDSLANSPQEIWLRRQLGRRGATMRTNSPYALYAAVSAGLGLGVLPCIACDGNDDLVRLDGPEPLAPREVWLVVHRDLRRTARIRAVIDFLDEVMRERTQPLVGR